MRSLDIVCPVFREEEMIELFHGQLLAAIESLNQRYRIRIIYVLDPSPDRTEALLCSITAADPRVEVIVMSRRFGHQAALIAGIDCSRGDAVVMLDSDMQHPPELIPQLVDHWEHGADIVQMIRKDGSETRLVKRLTSRWFYHLLQKIGAVDLPAGASDYRLLSQRVVQVVRAQITERNPFLRGLVFWVGFKIVHLQFKPSPRPGGRSHYGSSTLINLALNGICSFSKLPLRFCVGLGMAIACLSIFGGFLEIVFYTLGTIDVPGWSSLIAAMCFLSGVQLFFLGVIGEYIGLIFDEVKGRPRYIADRRYILGRPTRCEGAERTSIADVARGDIGTNERVELI
jgi:glycosyltransferase involved in cell wall biosynthesis